MFNTQTTFLGRNGEFKAIGVVIGKFDNDIVSIIPITSKNNFGRATIKIPVESIDDVINVLKTYKIESNTDNVESKTDNVNVDKISQINRILNEWGGVTASELGLIELPSFTSPMGYVILIREFYFNYVNVSIYQNGNEIDNDSIIYEDLPNNVIDDIYLIIEEYETDMIKTMNRCKS